MEKYIKRTLDINRKLNFKNKQRVNTIIICVALIPETFKMWGDESGTVKVTKHLLRIVNNFASSRFHFPAAQAKWYFRQEKAVPEAL